jgi:excisionase family DNA binding protein
MEAIQSYPNLLSEKQAAARLGVARITLLRAREAGRIRFFRIGTRVLYDEDQLAEFLKACERNAGIDVDHAPRLERRVARRKENQVSPSRRSIASRQLIGKEQTARSVKSDQASLPFTAQRAG